LNSTYPSARYSKSRVEQTTAEPNCGEWCATVASLESKPAKMKGPTASTRSRAQYFRKVELSNLVNRDCTAHCLREELYYRDAKQLHCDTIIPKIGRNKTREADLFR
jgi:hypothetical protein